MRQAIFSVLIILFSTSVFFSQSGIDVKNMDPSVRPQDDFYNFVNGAWMKTAVIPNDRARWGNFDALAENTDLKALEILKKSMSQKQAKGSDGQKIKDLYASIVDLKARNTKGIQPILPYLKKIDAIKNLADLQKYLIEVTPIGLNPLYDFGVDAHLKKSKENAVYLGVINLGLGRDYYQKDDEKSKQTLSDYTDYVSSIYTQTGQKTKDLKGPFIVEFEKSIAKNLLTLEQSRDVNLQYNPYAVKDIKNLVKNIDLSNYLTKIGVKTDSVIISEKKYYENLDQFLTNQNIPIIKDYLKFNLINNNAGRLSEDLENQKFQFYGVKLRGQKEQRALEKRALGVINGSVGEILGKLYVKEAFPPAAKESAKEMIEYLKKAFHKHISELSWMSKETKVKALDKLAKFTVKIGYPDKWKDYSKLKIKSAEEGGDYFSNMLEISKWRFNYDLTKIGKPVDKTRWGMSPQTVNAYYNPQNNEIVFPAAILQPPFFDFKADPAINFGGIGAVIGHEISHGFDDSGADFDGDGNVNNWWTKEDKENFEKATTALAEQYSAYEPLPGVKVNGVFTNGENIADLGGSAIAFDALEMYLKDKGNLPLIDGYTQQQRFFLSWATIWRVKTTDKALTNQVKTDPHSPGYFRAIGPLVNIDAFYNAFDVKEGDKMYKIPEKRIKIW